VTLEKQRLHVFPETPNQRRSPLQLLLTILPAILDRPVRPLAITLPETRKMLVPKPKPVALGVALPPPLPPRPIKKIEQLLPPLVRKKIIVKPQR
jgi:hypothetical protein